MISPKERLFRDRAERVLWTLAQAGLGVLTVEVLDIPVAYAPVVASVIALAKVFVSGKLGNKDSASSDPAV